MRVAHAEAGDFGDADDLRRGKAVQMHLREALLDGAQQIFVVLDAKIGMQAALQQDAGAAERDGLFDFLLDGFEREHVAFVWPSGR